MKIKTSELTGRALRWAIATAEGHVIHTGEWYGPFAPEETLKVSRLRSGNIDALCHLSGGVYQPDANWSQGGPIIEREWRAICAQAVKFTLDGVTGDEKPLLQFWMRCYVASRLGDEVDVPEELLA